MSDEIKKYQVISSGEVLKGFSILDVADALARQYNIEPSNAIETLISGSQRKVRSARSKAHGDSICAKLQALGLRCFVSEVQPDMSDEFSIHTQMLEPTDYDEYEDEVEQPSISTDEAFASIDKIYKDATEKVAMNKFIKRAGLIAIIVSVIGSGAWFSISQWLKPKPLTLVNQIESAMQSIRPTAALMFVDLNQSRKLSNFSSLFGAEDSLDASDLRQVKDLVLPLQLLGANSLFNNSNYMTASVYSQAEGSLKRSNGQWLMALTGQFKYEQLKQELSPQFKFISVSDNLVRLTPLDNAANGLQCRALETNGGSVFYANFQDDFVIFSSSKDLNSQFQSKLTGLKVREDQQSSPLESWNSFRNGSLLGVKIFDHRLIDSIPLVGKFIESNFANAHLDELSLKVDADMIDRDVSLQLAFMSDNENVLLKAEQTLKDNINDLKSHSPAEFINANNLLSQLQLANTGTLTMNAKLNSEFLADIDGVIIDLHDISNDVGLIESDDEPVQAFQALSKVWDHQRNKSFLEERKLRSKSPAIYQREGASIFLDSIGSMSGDLNGAKKIQLSALKRVPSVASKTAWSQSGIEQQLIVKDVLDNKGLSLMASNECFKVQPNDRSLLAKGLLKTEQSVNLRNGVNPDSIQQVQGKYKLLLPLAVQRIDVSMSSNRQASWGDGSLRLNKVKGSMVRYHTFGSQKSLLEMRAKNANGEYLEEKNTRTKNEITTTVFYGLVDSVELYVANQWQDLSFDFAVNAPLQKAINQPDKTYKNRLLKVFTKSERTAFRQKVPAEELVKVIATEPVELGRVTTKSANIIFKKKPGKGAENRLFGEVVVPYNELLLQSSDSLSVHLEINKKYEVEFSPQFSSANSPKEIVQLGSDRLLRGQFTIKLDEKTDEVKNLKGKIRFKMPSRFNRTLATIGDSPKDQLQVLSYEYGNKQSSSYVANKDYYSAILTTGSDAIYLTDKPTDNILKFATAAKAKKIELLTVSRYDRFSEKFNLSIK